MILDKRYYYTTDDDNSGITSSSTWIWGRWIMLALLVGMLAVFTLMTMTANRRRASRGQAPIYGTAWLTPPSYRQSQAAYNQSSVVRDQENVPMYTERANENDLGYYDNQGVFHKNEKVAYPAPNGPPPPTGVFNNGNRSTDSPPVISDETGDYLQAPESAYLRPNDDIDLEFRRPSQPNIRRNNTGPSSSLTDDNSSVSVQMQEVHKELKR